MHEVTGRIRDFYEQYPYPQRQPGVSGDPDLDWILSLSQAPSRAPWQVLDAGCGTGQSCLGAALLYPHFQVTAIDVNRKGLEQIGLEARQLGLSNLKLVEADLLELPEQLKPVGGFDLIHCTGVLHHTGDPARALRNLAAMLAPGGVMRLFVYGELGRSGLYRMARALRRLGEHLPLQERLSQGRALTEALEAAAQSQGRLPPQLGPAGVVPGLNDPEFVDRFLNPHDVPYRVRDFRSLIEGAGLKLVRWYEPRDWSLSHLLPGFCVPPLEPWEEWEVVEELFDRDRLDAYLMLAEAPLRQPEISLTTLLGTHPQVTLQVTSMRGISLQNQARVRRGPWQDLSREEVRLLQLLANTYGSLEQVRAYWEAEGQPLPPEAAHLEMVQRLYRQELLFCPHALP